MSVHLSGGGAAPRRVVLSCDVPGCPVQIEPPAAERWRSDPDARIWARDHAVGWTHDAVRGTDYCPDHAQFSTPPAGGTAAPRPTAAVRDSRTGDPLDRDDYAGRLRRHLATSTQSGQVRPVLTVTEAEVVARLLNELAGVYRGEDLGGLAREMAELLRGRLSGT